MYTPALAKRGQKNKMCFLVGTWRTQQTSGRDGVREIRLCGLQFVVFSIKVYSLYYIYNVYAVTHTFLLKKSEKTLDKNMEGVYTYN